MALSYEPCEKASEWHRAQPRNLVLSVFYYHPLTVRLPSVDNHMVFLKYGLYQVAINAHEFFYLILSLFYWLRL